MIQLLVRFLDWFRSFLWHKEMEITIVGLQDAGKTSLVNIITKNPCIDTIPTIGFNARTVSYGRTSIKLWDLGGERRFRSMWERYCRGVDAILYMVDAANLQTLAESARELQFLMKKQQLAEIPILVLGNKIDLPNAISENDFIDRMGLSAIENHKVCCYMTSCKNKENIEKVVEWLLRYAKN
ncbi:hypothetical protein JTE90_020326 [Oedothorax gibbosus]|uniref:ADP-ribosylation factor-like protein 8B n=1 Tax=Oedothorax gibbosus TaxID=931172 RepID=A0AAV6VR27_9ARAC|nr:hypothetical protein JTE90_020326 [Oedothorax gibbosus]